MHFSDIIAQEPAKALLRRMAEGGRIPHALMFLGPTGSGGLPLALAFAQFVLCTNRKGSESCGTCNNCVKNKKMMHPDVHFSFPTVGAKMVAETFYGQWRQAVAHHPYMNVQQWLERLEAGNSQGNITKDECDRITRVLSLKIFEASHKILVMWLPEYLGKEGNRLLKLIEEPPDDTLFFLVAQDPDQILPTILSRTQLVKVFPLDDEEITHALLDRNQVIEDEARAIAQLADGDFNAALSQLEEGDADRADFFIKWMRTCYQGKGPDMMGMVDKFAVLGREKQKFLMQYGLHFLREMTALHVHGDKGIRLRPAEFDVAVGMRKVLKLEKIPAAVQLFDDAAFHVERNLNPKILFLDSSLKMHRLMHQK